MVCHENSCLSGFTYQKESRLCKPNKMPDNCIKFITTRFNNLIAKRIDLRYSCGQCAINFTLNLKKDKCEPCPKNCNYCSIISAKNGQNLSALIKLFAFQNLISTFKPSDIKIICNCKKPEIYIPATKTCRNCSSNCESCHYNKEFMSIDCGKCSIDYIYNKKLRGCIKCPTNCKDCILGKTKQSICKICDKNFVVSKDGSCKTFPKGCLYTTQEDQCAICSKNYILKAGKCKLCQEGCESCLLISKTTHKPIFFDFNYKQIYDVEETCSSCYLGFYMEKGFCKKCPKGCSNCVLDEKSKNLSCLSCFPNYKINGESGICINCSSDCDSCYNPNDKNFMMNFILF